MTSAKIILAFSEEDYLFPLELKFLEDDSTGMDIASISDETYLKQFFETPRSLDLLLIDEALYTPDLLRHTIGSILILSERRAGTDEKQPHVRYIYKYANLKQIYHEALFRLQEIQNTSVSTAAAKVVTVYSAAGGCGKTSAALGIAACLSANHKRVLHIDAEYVQNACYFFEDWTPLPTMVSAQLQTPEEPLLALTEPYIRHERFDYLPPFRASLSALELEYDFYTDYIRGAKQSGKYDYIIVDTDCVLDEKKAKLLQLSDHIVMVMQQDAYTVMKTDRLQSSLDITNKDKFLYVCNFYEEADGNAAAENSGYVFEVSIPRLTDTASRTISGLSEIPEIQKLAFTLL